MIFRNRNSKNVAGAASSEFSVFGVKAGERT